MSEWFEERREGTGVVVTCSAHFVWAVFLNDRIRATRRQDLEERARRGERPIAVEFEVPPTPVTRGPRPPEEDLFGFTVPAEQYEKMRPAPVREYPCQVQLSWVRFARSGGPPSIVRRAASAPATIVYGDAQVDLPVGGAAELEARAVLPAEGQPKVEANIEWCLVGPAPAKGRI